MNRQSKNFALALLMLLVFVVLFQIVNNDMYRQPTKLTYTEFNDVIENNQTGKSIKSVTVKGNKISGTMMKGSEEVAFETTGFISQEFFDRLESGGVAVTIVDDGPSPFWNFLMTWLPMILIIGIFIFFMRQLQGSGGKAMSFGKSRARLLNETGKRITFEDVAGVDEAKEEL
ncbi:cell division protein FtsH, partial [bacterium]|nr:cell division protein FtsH [bacterium]